MRELTDYHRVIQAVLMVKWKVANRIPIDGDRLKRREQQVKDYQQARQQRWKESCMAHSSGPVLDRGEWQKDKVSRPYCLLTNLRQDPQSLLIKDTASILQLVSSFYASLLHQETMEPEGSDVEDFLDKAQVALMTYMQEEEEDLLGPIVEEEVHQALKAGRLTSTAGPDGLSYRFYRTFKGHLVPLLVKLFNEMWESGRVRPSFLTGIMVLLPKGGDTTLLTNWRPITVNNIDYCILTGILNTRLKKLASKFLSPGQTSGIRGRKMTHMVCLFQQIFHTSSAKQANRWLLQLDQQKAFDKVQQSYLWKLLKRQGIPDQFVQCIRALYAGARVIPYVQGTLGSLIPKNKGVRQGFPLSPLLYVAVLDPFLRLVRIDDRIRGIRPYPSLSFRISVTARADDVYFWMCDEGDLKRVRRHLTHYEHVSGAQVNKKVNFTCWTAGRHSSA